MMGCMDERLEGLFQIARNRIWAANGEWVAWHDLRPAYRIRHTYAEPLWTQIGSDPGLETREGSHGCRVRRHVRRRSTLDVLMADLIG